MKKILIALFALGMTSVACSKAADRENATDNGDSKALYEYDLKWMMMKKKSTI